MLPTISICFALLIGSDNGLGANNRNSVLIRVDPHITRQIDGISELDRKKYFNLSHSGHRFEETISDKQIFNRVVKRLNITFGRSLSPVGGATQNGKLLREDPQRPHFVDVDDARKKLEQRRKLPNRSLQKYFGDNLGVAAHGGKQSYPAFMGAHYSEHAKKAGDHAHALPDNIEAAAELAAIAFKYGYNDLLRPEFFEPINEPHWSYFSGTKLAEWHLATKRAFEKHELTTKVGGLCMSVCYMFKNNYKTWNGFRKFLDDTEAELDFYSFHVYDYLDFEQDRFVGRIQSGLPLEGVLDLVSNYSSNQFGKEVKLVVSEHGGYMSEAKGPEKVIDQLAQSYFPGKGFDWVMQKRSILNYQHVSSILTNTMSFLDHPHIIQKAVPFILLESMDWDPEYYATLYSPFDFEDKKRWVASRNADFFEFFRDLKGRRVRIYSSDPDIQLQAFASGNQLFVVLNNLSHETANLRFKIPTATSYQIRRLGHGPDLRPYLTEEKTTELSEFEIAGRESVLIACRYDQFIPERRVVNEIPYYGDGVVKETTSRRGLKFEVKIDELENINYATLRIGFRRPADTDRKMLVRFNGNKVDLNLEDCAPRLERDADFASTRFAIVQRDKLKAKNTINIKFPDGKGGTVGSVVMRVAYNVESETTDEKSN